MTATGVGEEDDVNCAANAIEVRHQVALEKVGPDLAVFTVTRELAARTPMRPVCLSRLLSLPGQSVVDSFSIRTDGTWRKGQLRPDPRVEQYPVAPPVPRDLEDRPCASLRWQPGGVYLEMSDFRPRGHIAIRYTLSAQGELQRGGRRWSYCADPFAGNGTDHPPVPEIVKVPDDPGVVVRADPESTDCLIIEKRVPPPPTLSARFGAYRMDHGWLWRLELGAPVVLATDWHQPESAPVVWVLDASRSMRRYGGIEPQIAVVRAYLANTPNARIELILTSRTAERVFGHLASPTELDDAVAGRLAATALRNGSFLDRGLELAADVLREAGTPGRVIFVSDGELRSRFNRDAAVATLKRAPRGTVVHWLFPEFGGSAVEHRAPGQIGDLVEVPMALGGAAYVVEVSRSDPSGAELVPLLKKLVSPDRLESLEMRDTLGGAEWPVWPDERVQGQIVAGDRVVWSGVSTHPPPARLAIVGWLWGKKVELGVTADPGLQRILPRLATSEGNLMDCVSSDRHAKRALAEGFLAPGLELWVPGSGDLENVGIGGGGWCGPPSVGAGAGRFVAPPPSELPHGIFEALEACHLLKAENGAIRVKLETYGDEIVDVAVQGASAEERRCAEEALWAMALPEDFNERTPWIRKDYTFGLSRSSKGDASP